MEMNFYSTRERAKLLAMQTPDGDVDEGLVVDPLKMEIAFRYSEHLWSEMYCKVKVVVHALQELGRYNTCKRLHGWVWYVPRTPKNIAFDSNPDVRVEILPVAHPERLDEYLEVIWNRPRVELAEIIKIIQAVELPGLGWVTWDSPDVNHNYWALSWVAGSFHNHNIVYLNRR